MLSAFANNSIQHHRPQLPPQGLPRHNTSPASLEATTFSQLRTMYKSKASLKEWNLYAARARKKAGLSTTYNGYTTRADICLGGVPDLDRCRELLDLTWGVRIQEFSDRPDISSRVLKKDLFVDLSQNPRSVRSCSGETLCTTGCWYSFEQDEVLDGCDTLCLQGMPAEVSFSPDLSQAEKRELAGESFHFACYTSVATAFWLNPWGGWW